MKILLIPEFSSFGGTRTHFKSLLEYYHAQNYKVHILMKKKQIDQEVRLLITFYGFSIIRGADYSFVYKLFGSKLGLIFDNILRVLRLILLKMYVRPLLVVYNQGDINKDILQLMVNKNYIYIVHSYPIKMLNSIIKSLLNRTLGPQRVILTVSKFSRNCICKYWATNDNKKYVYYIYNYVDPPCRENSIGIDRDTILTLGHVVDYKNPYFFIEVAKAVISKCKVKFIWAGEGPLLEACKRRAGKHNKDLIQFIGFKDDVKELYRSSIIYFQPSLVESHSISVLAAMSYGLPCVVSNVGGLPESVSDGYNGYVVAMTSIEEAVEKIILLIDNEELRKLLGDNAVRSVKKEFNKNIWMRKMNHLHNHM